MDLPLALLMESYLAERGTATAAEFAAACGATADACRAEYPVLLAWGADWADADGLRSPG